MQEKIQSRQEHLKPGARVRRSATVVLVLLMILSISSSVFASYSSWTEIAAEMTKILAEARDAFNDGNKRLAADKVNEAYFGYYETTGFEKNVNGFISGKRKVENENAKTAARRVALEDGSEEAFIEQVELWVRLLHEDAATLDGLDAEASVAAGAAALAAFRGEHLPDPGTDPGNPSPGSSEDGGKKSPAFLTFLNSFGLAIREGLEAILVIVAILAYLDKTKNKKYCRSVYIGALAGVVVSAVLAVVFNIIRHRVGAAASGVGQEVFEGFAMFLAVLVLFWVSNWMLSKSETEVWERYIQNKVESAVTRGSAMALVFSAFLAVAREGAELILFYQALQSNAMSSPAMIWVGLATAILVLAVVFYAFRKLTVRLPLKPFFYFTSMLMYILCLSFIGKGVSEFQEAGWIAETPVAWMNGFIIDLLGVYPYVETMLAQLALLALTVLVFVIHRIRTRKHRAAMDKEQPGWALELRAKQEEEKAVFYENAAMLRRAKAIFFSRKASEEAGIQNRDDLAKRYVDRFADYPGEALDLYGKLDKKGRLGR